MTKVGIAAGGKNAYVTFGGDGVFKARDDGRRMLGSAACGLEALEGRQFLSTTYVAKRSAAPLHLHHAATVQPLVTTAHKTSAPSVKRSRTVNATVIQLDGPG